MRILSVFIFLFYNCCFSQFKITHYNSENGLPHDLCYQIIQDHSGYIWLGTDNGLVKFNGSRFLNYGQNQGLGSGFVIGVSNWGSSDKKLVATWGAGAYFFSGNKFTPIGDKDFRHQKLNQVIEFEGKIFAIENKSRLRVYKNQKSKSLAFNLYKINGKYVWYNQQESERIKEYVRNNKIASGLIQLVKVKNELFCISDKYNPRFPNILKVDGTNKIYFPFPFLKDIIVVGLYSKDNHFLAVSTNELIEFDNERILSRRKINFPDRKIIQFADNQELEVYLTQNNATNNHEIVLFEKKNGKYVFLNENKLKAPVSDVLLSKEGILWISTYGNGLFSFSRPQVKIERDFLRNQYSFDFLATDRFNFFATTDKIICSDKANTSFKAFSFPGIVHFKHFSNDTLYALTKKQDAVSKLIDVCYVSNRQRMSQRYVDGKKIVFGDASLYVSSRGRLTEVVLKVPNWKESNLKIQEVIKYGKAYWVATNHGVFLLDENLRNTKRITEKDGLLSEEIVDFEKHDSKLWLLSVRGLTVYENGKLTKFPYINDKNDYFNDFAVDDNGIAWFASQKGIVRFQNGHYYRYTKNEGLTSGFYSKLYLAGNDRLLCLGNKGVIVFQTGELKKAKSLSITLETKEGKSITDRIIELDHDSDFGITADVINFSKSEYILEYRLNNDEWAKLEGNTVDFSNFSSGNFTLQFRARYYFSDWSYSSKITIDKVSPWYFRWYVLASGIVLVLIVVFGIVNLRFKRLRERNQKLQDLLDSNQRLETQLNEMRHNIAQDFHDELGNKLAGITVMSDQLLHTEELKNSDDYAVVERINKDSQDLFQGIRDFIWAIDSKNGTLEELIFALTDFGEELFQYSGIKFIVESEVEEAKLLLPHYWNRQLLLLFKEAMTNTFKYSQAKTGTLIFKVEENKLYIEFKDDGIGFDPKTITRRNGLFNLQKRADKLKGQLVISSVAGTSIIFIGKLE